MNRFVPTALTTVALLVPASVARAVGHRRPGQAGTAVTGTWKGQVFGDKGADAGYSARVRIFKRNGELRGRVASGGCYGVWRYRGRSNGWYRFAEVITRNTTGDCVKRVAVKVRRDDAKRASCGASAPRGTRRGCWLRTEPRGLPASRLRAVTHRPILHGGAAASRRTLHPCSTPTPRATPSSTACCTTS